MGDSHFLELNGEAPAPKPAVLEYWDLCRIAPPQRLVRRFTLAFLDRYRWVPLHETPQDAVTWLPPHVPAPRTWGPETPVRLFVALAAPEDGAALQAIALRAGRTLRVLPVADAALDRFLAERYPAQPPAPKGGIAGWWSPGGKR